MGETAVVLGVRQWSDRQSVLGHDDELLVAGVRAGDRAAFEEIYDRYARGILAFCVHMLGSREAAEDALQLTFVAAYRALQGGDSSIALRPWLYTIARNRCLSELRARREALGVDEPLTDTPVIEGLADQVQRREDLREMLDDMQRLPADQRAALVLFELGDHPQKDIATVLGVRTEKVKALVFQAREALVRGRAAREHPCRDIREQLATLEGRIPARSMLRAHIERCSGCQSFEHEVRHQRAALALILPVALTGELKSWILGSAVHSGGAVAAGVGACGGGVAVVGGATVASGMGGAGAISAATAGGIAGAGAGTAAIATSAPLVAAAAGLTAVGESVGGLSATAVMAKILTAAAIATVAASSSHGDAPTPHPSPAAKPRHHMLAPATPLAGVRAPARRGGTAIGVPPTVTATPLGSPASAPSSTPVTSTATSTATSSASTTTTTTTGTGAMTPPAAGGAPGNGATSTPSAAGTGPTSGGTSNTASAPAGPGSGATTPPSSGSSSTSDGTGSSAPASANPASSPSSDQTSTPTSTSPPPAGPTAGPGGSASAPSTAATDPAGASTGTTSTAANTAPASSPATAPSTSTASAPLSATAAAPANAAASASSAATAGS